MFKGLWFFIKFGWKNEKRYIIYLLVKQFIVSLIPIVAVIMPKFLIDELMQMQRINFIILYVAILLGYSLAARIISNWLTWKCFTYRVKVAGEFGIYMNSKTMNVDYADLESSKYLEIKEKANKFLFGNLNGFSYVLDIAVELIGKAITLIGVIAVIFTLNPLMVLLFVALVVSNTIIEAITRKKQVKLSLNLTVIERRWMYLSNIMEDFSYGKEIRINNMEDWLIKKEREHAAEALGIYTKSNNFGIKSGSFSAVASFLQQGSAYTYLVFQIIRNQITIGEFSMYIGGVLAFSTAMKSVMSAVIEVSQFRHYYDAIEEYLNIPYKMQDNKKLPLPEKPYTIEFRNVWFKYNESSEFVLRDINLKISSGSKMAVVGENGAGKTTFIKLLCRIYDPSKGDIYLNGINIRDIEYKKYMTLFSTVFQDYKLFSFSLIENVALSDEADANKEKVREALFKSGFAEKLSCLEDGLNTNVYKNFNDKGFEPSGGEGQKIALARAIYKDAPIMILDEPTSALDPKAEYRMYMNFNEVITSDKLAVYISHRLASTQFCDIIIVFNNGVISENGSHSELMKMNSIYADMYKLQAGLYMDNK